MKRLLLSLVIAGMSIAAFSQSEYILSKLDTIPIIPIEFVNHEKLEILNYNIIESFILDGDTVLIYNDKDGSIKLILSDNETTKIAEIGVKYYDANAMNLYSATKDLKYTAAFDSLGTMNPFLILNWKSIAVSTSGVCFGNSGYTTNETTKTQNGITLIDLKNATIVFTGLTGYSTRHTNIGEGGFGGSCSRVILNREDNVLTLKHVTSDSKSQTRGAIRLVGDNYNCPENNIHHFYKYELKESTDYQLKNGMFVKL